MTSISMSQTYKEVNGQRMQAKKPQPEGARFFLAFPYLL